MKVLVTGGRNYKDYAELTRVLNHFHNLYEFIVVIHGNAKGADELTEMWAKSNGIHTCKVDALWHYHELGAGFIRNTVMLELNPDYVIAFPGGPGTASMIQIAEKSNVPVEKVL